MKTRDYPNGMTKHQARAVLKPGIVVTLTRTFTDPFSKNEWLGDTTGVVTEFTPTGLSVITKDNVKTMGLWATTQSSLDSIRKVVIHDA